MSRSTTIFISREIDEEAWSEYLPGCNVIGKSLLTFSPVKFELPTADWVFFYSQNGVTHFFNQMPGQLAPHKWAAIGPKTAELLSTYVMDVDLVGNGNGKDTALMLDDVVNENETICFVRAKHSMRSVQKHLSHKLSYDVVVYENMLSDDVPTTVFDILIFTSPRNAKAYLAKRTIGDEVVIAIGTTTQKALRELGVSQVYVPADPQEGSIIQLIREKGFCK